MAAILVVCVDCVNINSMAWKSGAFIMWHIIWRNKTKEQNQAHLKIWFGSVDFWHCNENVIFIVSSFIKLNFKCDRKIIHKNQFSVGSSMLLAQSVTACHGNEAIGLIDFSMLYRGRIELGGICAKTFIVD